MDGLNEIIKANRTNKYVGAKLERENVAWVVWHAKAAMQRQGWQPMTSAKTARKVSIMITFVETSRRRDVPNIIGGGLKYVLDGLSRPRGEKLGAAAIYDDSQKWLVSVLPRIEVSKEHPGIRVSVFPIEEKDEDQ